MDFGRTGRRHPQHLEPGPGQESVWDYPRPPALDPDDRLVEVMFNGKTIASTQRAIRVLETSHPPTFYIPPEDVAMEYLREISHRTVCEWKGMATYYTVQVSDKVTEQACWSYLEPVSGCQAIARYMAFYPQKVDACYVSGELVKAQPGNFYAGWITSEIVGPFKGIPGTMYW